jgi:pyruvate carboxylase
VVFELNGIPRSVDVRDKMLDEGSAHRAKADANDPTHIGSTMPGMVVAASEGDQVTKRTKTPGLRSYENGNHSLRRKSGQS